MLLHYFTPFTQARCHFISCTANNWITARGKSHQTLSWKKD